MRGLLSSVYLTFYKKCKNRRYKDLKNRKQTYKQSFLEFLLICRSRGEEMAKQKQKRGRRQRQDVR